MVLMLLLIGVMMCCYCKPFMWNQYEQLNHFLKYIYMFLLLVYCFKSVLECMVIELL